MDAIRNQSYPIKEILIWENGEEYADRSTVGPATLIRSEKNFGVWARFALALNGTCDFTWLIDDDVIPGERWLESALETFNVNPGVIGSRGLRFNSSRAYLLYEEVGPNNPNEAMERVDIVGHNWVFPTAWLGYFWAEIDKRFDSPFAGEDIHLSYAVQKHLGLGTYTPPHSALNRSTWGELPNAGLFDGLDKAGISNSPGALGLFEKAYAHYIKHGFTIEANRLGKESLEAKLLGSAAHLNPDAMLRAARLVGKKKKRR